MVNSLRMQKHERIGYLFVLPALLFMIVLIGFPILYNIWISFLNIDVKTFALRDFTFQGLANYTHLFSDILPLTILNTFLYTLGSIVFQFTIGFALALFFCQNFSLSERIRGLLLISWMLPATVVGLLFKFMLSPSCGILNFIMMRLQLIDQPIPWLIDSSTALASVTMTNIWVGIPFNMILLTTGLKNIPNSLYESAVIDGAGRFQRLTWITIPMMKPTIMVVLILGFIYTFKVFDLIYVMTGGGPVNATEVLSTYSYRLSFSLYYFSRGAAAANVLFVLLFVVSLGYLKMINLEETNV